MTIAVFDAEQLVGLLLFGNWQRRGEKKAETADVPTLRRCYLDLAASYGKFADMLGASP